MAVGSAPAVVVSSTLPQMDTGQEMILSSSMTLTTRKTKYSMNMMDPSSLLMRHLQAAMEMMTNSSMRKRRTMAQKSPLELTCTGLISLIKDQRSQGNGRPTVMSKILEPTELDTAISPRPLRATITLVMRSGMEVPAANIVRPIISSVIPIVSPTW